MSKDGLHFQMKTTARRPLLLKMSPRGLDYRLSDFTLQNLSLDENGNWLFEELEINLSRMHVYEVTVCNVFGYPKGGYFYFSTLLDDVLHAFGVSQREKLDMGGTLILRLSFPAYSWDDGVLKKDIRLLSDPFLARRVDGKMAFKPWEELPDRYQKKIVDVSMTPDHPDHRRLIDKWSEFKELNKKATAYFYHERGLGAANPSSNAEETDYP